MSFALQRHRRLQNSSTRWLHRATLAPKNLSERKSVTFQNALAPKGDGGSKGSRIGCTGRRWLQRAMLAPN
jgi:hypothetical protein